MNDIDIENRLSDLGTNWPIGSVSDAVVQHIKTHQVRRNDLGRNRRRQLTWVGSIAALLMLFASLSMLLFGTSQTLQAQVRDAIARSKAVQLEINSFDSAGMPTQAQIWYSSELGFRAESTDKVLVDNGSTQWSWDPRSTSNIVTRRGSQDGMSMIGTMLNFESVPTDWHQSRAADQDQEFDGQACQAYFIQPPSSLVGASGDASQQRIYFWRDAQQRVVNVQTQSLTNQAWQPVRTIKIAYDREIDTEKFAYSPASKATVIDADRLWEQRFPIERALASSEVGGLKFAVHEVTRCGTDMFYVVSSVRGTDDYLKNFPPQRRKLNLETTVLDVAEQVTSSVQQDCHIATLSTAEFKGVHYMWWIAAQRTYFRTKDDAKVYENQAGTKLEVIPGKLKLPILANYRGTQVSQGPVTVQLELQVGDTIESLTDVSKRVRQDASLSQDGPSIYMFEGTSLHVVRATETTDQGYAANIQNQLDWLRSNDKLGDANLGLPPN